MSGAVGQPATGSAAAGAGAAPARIASLRDYLTLTKPRVMALLLLTGFCALVADARVECPRCIMKF